MTSHRRQREADAALFEDWSPWTGLVYVFEEWGVFELRPASARSSDRAARIPGIARSCRHGHIMLGQRPWHLPLERWRDLRAALPEIKALDDAYAAEQATETARIDVTGEALRAARVRATTLRTPPSERTLGERIDVLATAYLMRDPRLTTWDRRFVADTATRWHRFGERARITGPQRRQIDRIHEAVADTVVL